jgi:hypothetical protein
MSVGYSGKTLAEKLGIRAGTIVHVVNAPPDYDALLGELPQGATVQAHADGEALAKALGKARAKAARGGAAERLASEPEGRVDFIHLAAPLLAQALAPGGALWLSWPKLTAAKRLGLSGDVSEQSLRDALLPHGFVDVKVCAVSETWSGLLFRWRVKK